MQDREKKLAIGLGAVLVIAFGLPMFESWFLEPLTIARNELSSTQERVGTLVEQEHALKQARRNLEDWRYDSLPPNPFTAQREYQEWLMDMARMSGFVSPVPTLSTVPTRGRTFVEIPVTIEAKATLEQLTRFLYHVERVALLHRVQTLTVESPASVGNPLLDVTVVARGLSLLDAPQRSRLFPTTTLLEGVDAATNRLTIDAVKGFPLIDGFQIKIDEELMTVVRRDEGQWTVERGAEQTTAVAHPAESLVELFPVDRETMDGARSFETHREIVEHSPFVKPSPPVHYEPKLSPATAQTVTRGTAWTLKLSLAGWDPSGGPAIYSVREPVPDGLRIDKGTGEVSWNPGPDVPAQEYSVAVMARSDILSGQQVELTIPVTLREPNLPPVVTPIAPVTAYSGRALSIAVKAEDPDGEAPALQFTLKGDVPAGATIDEKTGLLAWTPPLTLELGDYTWEVAVTDGGDPQQTTTQPVSVKLLDDAALFTRLVGFFQNDGVPEVMFNNLTSGETQRMARGAEVAAADIAATIVAIEPTHILLESEGQTFRLEMGKSIRQMTPVEAPPDGDSAPPPSTE